MLGRATHSALLAAAVLTTVLTPAEAANAVPDPQQMFANLYRDLGLLAAGSVAIGVIVIVLRSLRDAGYLSDRWRFGEECDQD